MRRPLRTEKDSKEVALKKDTTLVEKEIKSWSFKKGGTSSKKQSCLAL